MKSLRSTCLFAAIVSVFSLAQSSRAPLADQVNSLPDAPQQVLHRNLFEEPQRASSAPPKAQGSTGSRGQSLPMQQGLNFAPPVVYGPGGPSARSIALADVNGDGVADIVVGNGSTVGVLLGNGDGTFQTAVSYGSGGSYAWALGVADVNADGKPDIVVWNGFGSDNFDNTLGVLLGNGDGTFQTAVTYGTGGFNGADSIVIADVNGDGKPDIEVANFCSDKGCYGDGTVGVLLGNGDGTFQTAVHWGSGGYLTSWLAVADVNGDGKPDMVVTNNDACPLLCSEGELSVLLGNGDGTFQDAQTYDTSGRQAQSVAVADLNDDGKPDLVVANLSGCNPVCENGPVAVLLGNGDGTFEPAVTYDMGGYINPTSVAVADLNGDGKPDIAVADGCGNSICTLNSAVGVLLGNGDGTFQTAVTFYSGGYRAYLVTTGDMNGDGKVDLLVANDCNQTNCTSAGTVGVLINTSLFPTTTALVSSQNPSNFGQAVTFTATVTPQYGQGKPTGLVTFHNGAKNIGNSNLNTSGVATLTITALPVGTDSITATYNGDSNFQTSTSPILYQVVQGAIVTLSPTGLNFGNQTVGIPSKPQNVMLTNTGNINLMISIIQITGVNMSDFTQNNNCPASLAPNNSCRIAVTFKPTATGTRNAAVSVSDNAPGSPQSASLMGVGVLPAVMFSPTSLTFPVTVVFSASAAQKVTLTNTGLGVLEITSAKISPQFGVSTDCGKTLASGASCAASVTFKPTTKGPINGSISLTDNASNSPQQVPLSGTGTFVQLTPPSLNFGTQPVNTTSVPKVITLVNKGDATVNFTGTGISIGGADPNDFAQTNNCGTSVASGGHCYIKVTFTPSQLGSRTGDVSISDDGGGSPQVVPLAGTGTP